MKTKEHNLKIGDLVYLKDVGFPFDRADEGHESWEGASCIVIELNTGADKSYIRVEPLFPIGGMKDCIFWPHVIKKESRPWLKRNLKNIIKYKYSLIDMSKQISDIFGKSN